MPTPSCPGMPGRRRIIRHLPTLADHVQIGSAQRRHLSLYDGIGLQRFRIGSIGDISNVVNTERLGCSHQLFPL